MSNNIPCHIPMTSSEWKSLTLRHNNSIPHLLEFFQAYQTCFTYETIDICYQHSMTQSTATNFITIS